MSEQFVAPAEKPYLSFGEVPVSPVKPSDRFLRALVRKAGSAKVLTHLLSPENARRYTDRLAQLTRDEDVDAGAKIMESMKALDKNDPKLPKLFDSLRNSFEWHYFVIRD